MTSRVLTLFYSVQRPFQVYFSSYETGQSEGGAKTGEAREKQTWHTRKQNFACLRCGQSGALTARPRGPPIIGICNVTDNVHNNNVNFH